MILAVIPARGGSKGIPGKNIKDLYGQPLISYTIQAALDCKKIDRVVVSTDSEEIAVFGNIKFEKTQAVEIWLAFLYVENVDYKREKHTCGQS